MQSSPRERLLQFAHVLQSVLFDRLEPELGPFSERARLLAGALSMLPLSRWIRPQRGWQGRPSKDRHALASAFLAKAVYGLGSTRQLLERLRTDSQLRCLCGWNTLRQIPHESTFSRAFAEFAKTELPQRLQEALIECTQKDRLIGHIARDSTAIEERERFPEPKPAQERPKRRPKRCPARERGTRLERQRKQTLAEHLAALSQDCGIGVKKSSKGHLSYWRGYS
jgi:hypothetical protein